MAVSERPLGLARVDLRLADVPAGLALSSAAGWNQTAEDWALFIERGRAIGLRSTSGQVVASAAALPYGGRLGWISMVLVAEGYRHRGLASRLMDDCVRFLQQRGSTPVLDATPAGAEVYHRLGFVPGFSLERWEGMSDPGEVRAMYADLRVAGAQDLDAIAALDAAVSRVDRRFLLESFLRRDASRAWMARDASGFAIARRGRRATQLGPLVAADIDAAQRLLEVALAAESCPVFLDVPTRWSGIATWLEQRGFTRQRGFVRMALGAAEVPACSERSFVLAGPEFG